MITVEQVNRLLEIEESYKAPDVLYKKLFDKNKRESLFRSFLEIEQNLGYEWFQTYFENEHSDRKVKKQDFTPNSLSVIISKIIGHENGSRLDVTAGTGGITIAQWDLDRKDEGYRPSNYFYQCEELSDRAIPFLLFNLLIRGVNATVVHGDVLTREIKQIYFIQNDNDDATQFSSLNVVPQSMMAKKEFNVSKWLEDAINHVESPKELLNRRGDSSV